MKIQPPLFFSKLPAERQAVIFSILGMTLIFLLLESWRFPFFLTEDNLSGGYPMYAGMLRQFESGSGYFLDPYLNGGSDFSQSIERLYHFNPVPLLLMKLLGNKDYFVVDACALIYLLVGSVSQTFFLSRIATVAGAELKPVRLCFLSLASFTSLYHLVVFSSWGLWPAAAAALPWIGCGIVSPSWKKGFLLVFSGTVFLFLMGDLHPFFYGMLFLGIFSVAFSWCSRSLKPALGFAAGIVPAALVLFILIAPAFHGFEDSERAGGLSIHDQSIMSVPMIYFVVSSFWGAWSSWFFPVKPEYFYMPASYASGIACSACAWLCIPVFFKTRPPLFHWLVIIGVAAAGFMVFPGSVALLMTWIILLLVLAAANCRSFQFGRLEWSLLGILFVICLLIDRPHWLGWIISHLPLYSSLRWPFRELMIFHFFGAAFLAATAMKLSPKRFWTWAAIGSLVMLTSTFFHQPPSINPMDLDRRLILSGVAAKFWKEQKKNLPANTRIAVVLDEKDVLDHHEQLPYSLLGAFNYPTLFEIPSYYGYTIRGGHASESSRLQGRPAPFDHSGAITRPDVPELLKRFPNTTLVSMASFNPLRIRFESPEKQWEVEVEKPAAP